MTFTTLPSSAPNHLASAATATPRTAADKPRIESQALFNGQVEIEIEHLSQVYRLRQTSLGKLILTK